MSGGSFNYVAFKVQDDNPFEALHDLKAMEQWLREKGKHDAADEILKLILMIETAERRINVMVKRIYDILHGAEWWGSSDWGEEQFDKVVTKVLHGEEE